MTISADQVQAAQIVTNMVPIGGVAQVLRSGDAYKAVGELVKRSDYPALSTAFPRNGSLNSVAGAFSGGFHVNGIAYGNPSGTGGVFVAVGYTQGSGTPIPTTDYWLSGDGVNWSKRKLPSSQIWAGVGYGNGKFVALASDGAVGAYSTDGYNWIATTLPSTAGWASPVYGAGVWVTVSTATGTTSALSSVDGITWTARTLPTSTNWKGIAFGNGVFIAWSAGLTSAATSTNGTSWTARTLPVSFTSVTYAAGSISLYIGLPSSNGVIYTSPDAVTWTARTAPGEANYGVACYGDGVIVAYASPNKVTTSYDGINWSYLKLTATTATAVSYSVYGDGRMLAMFNGSVDNTSAASCAVIYAENLVDSTYLYLSGTAGQFIRVK